MVAESHAGAEVAEQVSQRKSIAISKQFRQFAGRRVLRKLTRALPWLGAAVAVATVGGAIRRKGVVRGTLHSALDLAPVVGTLKNLTELGLGRDLFRDKPPRA